jgi:ketosteroid isomerase-like protein
MEALTELFDASASSLTTGRSTLARDHQGREAPIAQFGRYAGETGGTFKTTLQRVLTGDDGRVIGMRHNTAKRNGKQLDASCCIVVEITDSRIMDGRAYVDDLSAWDEPRSSPRRLRPGRSG